MSEYEELREKIEQILSQCLDTEDTTECTHLTEEEVWRLKDQILSIIADKCWLKDNNFVEPLQGGIASAFWLEGWRPVKEIKKGE